MRRPPDVALGEVLAQDRAYIDEPEPREYLKLSVKLYGRGVELDNPADGSSLRMRRHQLARAGQVVLSEIWGKKGAIGIVPAEGEGALCTSHFFLFYINPKRVEPKYLSLIFRANYLESQLGGQARGTTGYAAVRPKHLLNATIPLPPLGEQRRIVERVEAVASRVEEARRLRAEMVHETRAIEMTAAQEIVRACPGPRAPLGSIVAIKSGATPSKGNPAYWSGTIPWISPKDMKVREIADSQDHVSELATIEAAVGLLPPDAVLIVTRGMILAHTVPVARLLVPAAINQDIKALITGDRIAPDYLTAVLWAENPALLALVERSTHDTRKLQTPKLMDFTIPVPTRSEQQAVLARLADVHEKMAAISETQASSEHQTAAILPALLQRAFAGEL